VADLVVKALFFIVSIEVVTVVCFERATAAGPSSIGLLSSPPVLLQSDCCHHYRSFFNWTVITTIVYYFDQITAARSMPS
jgi:hypothetical protein